MGGLGKTTLARKIYTHKDVEGCFEARAWEHWDVLCTAFPIVEGKCKVLLTTRNENIAAEEFVYKLKFLSEDQEIHSSIIYTTVAKEIWDDLKIRFQQSNGPRVFQLRRDLATLTQDTQSVNIYFTRLKSIWDELHTYRPALVSCPSNCGNAQKIHDHNQEEYVMAFLMGLNSSFDNLREQVLLMDPLPPINRVFALATQAERQKLVGQKTQLDLSSSMAFTSKISTQQHQPPRPYNQFKQSNQSNNFKKKDKPTCAHCNIQGHTIDKCYKLHGYPPGYQFKPKQQNFQSTSVNQVSDDSHLLHNNQKSQTGFCTTDDTSHPINNLLQSFTAEQCQHLMNLFSSQMQFPSQTSAPQNNESAHISCVSALVFGWYTLSVIVNHISSSGNKLRETILDIGNCDFSSDEGFVLLEKRLVSSSLTRVLIDGRIGRLPRCEARTLCPSLVEATFSGSEIENDLMEILEKLPMLKKLGLTDDAFVGSKMICSAFGFPQLEYLLLATMPNLEEWTVEKGAMSKLSCHVIFNCR
ncbi:hypothetical protein RD792_003823 [Penstemon davidsonii]|uniref:NB-ARC domain-containing protein n=1 Tax=Penstemon davidsonii TaxID=160366 RepID=A0ABR0DGX4_9LAMI|nr:hypothetical protein RD792_003823 [Penstemon davidsonii]